MICFYYFTTHTSPAFPPASLSKSFIYMMWVKESVKTKRSHIQYLKLANNALWGTWGTCWNYSPSLFQIFFFNYHLRMDSRGLSHRTLRGEAKLYRVQAPFHRHFSMISQNKSLWGCRYRGKLGQPTQGLRALCKRTIGWARRGVEQRGTKASALFL